MEKRAAWLSGAKIVLLSACILALIYFIFFTKSGIRMTHTYVRQTSYFLQSFGAYSFVIGMLAVYLQVMIPFVPFLVVAGANVLMFGLPVGFTINYIMSFFGALTAFMFSRTFGHGRVERKLSRYPVALAFNKKLKEQGFIYILFVRMIPFIPSFVVNLGAGITKIKLRDFLLATLIGNLPMIFLESLIGHDLLHIRESRGRLLFLLAIFVLLMIVGNKVKSRWSDKTAS